MQRLKFSGLVLAAILCAGIGTQAMAQEKSGSPLSELIKKPKTYSMQSKNVTTAKSNKPDFSEYNKAIEEAVKQNDKAYQVRTKAELEHREKQVALAMEDMERQLEAIGARDQAARDQAMVDMGVGGNGMAAMSGTAGGPVVKQRPKNQIKVFTGKDATSNTGAPRRLFNNVKGE